MAGGKGGSQSSQVEIPAYLENASKKSLNRAEQVQDIGYMPYMGPDVAAFTQPQQQAMQANLDAGAAFGLVDPGMSAMDGMPQAQDFGGVQGHSSFPMYQMAVDDLKASRPGQVAAYDKMYVDPVTGEGGHNSAPQNPQFPGGLMPGGPTSPYVQGHSSNISSHLAQNDPFGDIPQTGVNFSTRAGQSNPNDINPYDYGSYDQMFPDDMIVRDQLNNQQLAGNGFNQGNFNQGLDMTSAQLLGRKFDV